MVNDVSGFNFSESELEFCFTKIRLGVKIRYRDLEVVSSGLGAPAATRMAVTVPSAIPEEFVIPILPNKLSQLPAQVAERSMQARPVRARQSVREESAQKLLHDTVELWTGMSKVLSSRSGEIDDEFYADCRLSIH